MVTAIKNTPLFFYGDPEVTNYLWDVGVIHVSEQLGFVQPYPSHLSWASHQRLWWWPVPPNAVWQINLSCFMHLCPPCPLNNYSSFKWMQATTATLADTYKHISHCSPSFKCKGKKPKTTVKTFYQVLKKKKEERTYFDLLFSSNTYSHLSLRRKKRFLSITTKLHWCCVAKIHKIMQYTK